MDGGVGNVFATLSVDHMSVDVGIGRRGRVFCTVILHFNTCCVFVILYFDCISCNDTVNAP